MADEFAVNFRESLLAKRRNLSAKSRRSKSPKRIIWLYPKAQENQYYSIVKRLVTNPMKEISRITISGSIDRWVEEKKREDRKELEKIKLHFKKNPTYAYIPEDRKDAFPDEIRDMGNRMRSAVQENIGDADTPPEQTELWGNLSILADTVYDMNLNQFNKQTLNVLGFEYRTRDFWWPDLKRRWMLENYENIRGMSENYITLISEGLNRGIRNGWSIEEIIEEVNKINKKVFENKSSLLATDQIGKLTGQIAKNLQRSIGIENYIWRTQKDKRVRGNPKGLYPRAFPSHWDMEGKICNWKDDKIYANKSDVDYKTGKIDWRKRTLKMPKAIPGEEFRCRCVGEPYWDLLIRSVDDQIKEEES